MFLGVLSQYRDFKKAKKAAQNLIMLSMEGEKWQNRLSIGITTGYIKTVM